VTQSRGLEGADAHCRGAVAHYTDSEPLTATCYFSGPYCALTCCAARYARGCWWHGQGGRT